MSDFDRLRRGSYRPDGARKAAEQEAEELGRAQYRVDAQARAAAQEAADRAAEEAEVAEVARRRRQRQQAERGSVSQRRAQTSDPRDKVRDVADHTVIRRPQTQPQVRGDGQLGGGAVISRRSGLGIAVRRWLQGRRRQRDEERAQRRPSAREQRAVRRERRGRAAGRQRRHHPLLALLVVLVAAYLLVCGPIDRAISFSRTERQGLSHELSWHVPGLPYYVLALGSDAREGETTSRTDTMVLVRVDPMAAKLTLVSIPRDTMVQIEGQGTQKINAAYTFGGVAGAVRAVSDLAGVPISHAALIRFDGVEELVDALGGVTVDVPVEVYDPDYTGLVLPAGTQEMDGHTALLWSRVRHGFAMGDYQRQKDQRLLIEAIMRKALSLSPLKMPGVVAHMGGMVGTSMRMYSLLPLMVRLKLAGEVTVYQTTVPSASQMVDGVSYEVTDAAAFERLMAVVDAGGDPQQL